MKLSEALLIINEPVSSDLEPFKVFLACGFSALHLETYLKAYLRVFHSERAVEVSTGLFEDLPGNIRKIESAQFAAGVIVIEWPDLDPRLGHRHLGGWRPTDLLDICNNVRARVELLWEVISQVSAKVPVVICLPTLPLPPLSFMPSWQASELELLLRDCLSSFAVKLTTGAKVKLSSPQRLDLRSPLAARFDINSELHFGFPYQRAHAAMLAEMLAQLIHHRVPKKGLITDLDNTLWNGILGDVGPNGVHWDLEHKSQIHGLYQQLLGALVESGVLVAIASKNDLAAVEEVLNRRELLVPKQRIFPIEVHWHRKSESVGRILKAWNVSADSVVFIDDSPMEIAEVKSAFPEMDCITFSAQDASAVYELLFQLRNLFGKEALQAEDVIRMNSLQQAGSFQKEFSTVGHSLDSFLGQLEAELSITIMTDPPDPRALELVNKTNQFNLNGRRYTLGEWMSRFRKRDAFLLMVDYRDKYGPLGKIAVISGSIKAQGLFVDTWVMSCRAFSRRIEYKCLELLFEQYGVQEIIFDFAATSKNGSLREFFKELKGAIPDRELPLSKTDFIKICPQLFHQVKQVLGDS